MKYLSCGASQDLSDRLFYCFRILEVKPGDLVGVLRGGKKALPSNWGFREFLLDMQDF